MINIPIWLFILLIIMSALFIFLIGITLYVTWVMHKKDNREFGEYFDEKYGEKEE